MPLEAKIFNSVSEIPKAQWNQLVKQSSITYSHEFWEILAQAELNDFSYRYVLFYDNDGTALALSSFYTITTDIAIFAPNRLRTLLQQVRRVLPNFLKIKMLECGTPITLNSPFAAGDQARYNEIVTSLSRLLLSIAKKQGHFMIVLRDFEPHTAALWPEFKKLGFHFVDSLPTTYLDISWSSIDDYLASLKSYYRSKLLKHLRINATQGVHCEIREDFADLAEELCRQWRVVHDHASEYQREILTPAFYREFSLKMAANSKVLLFYRQNKLIGHALLLIDGDLLRWLYFGRNQAGNDSLYLYVVYQVIAAAIEQGATKLEMGLTTYGIKKDLGAYMSPIKLALQAPAWWINPFVGLVYPLLNHTPKIENKAVFKNR